MIIKKINDLKHKQPTKYYVYLAFAMVIILIFINLYKLFLEYQSIYINNLYPAYLHFFNSNIYLGFNLLIFVINLVVIAPIVEEFFYRSWFKNSSITNQNKFLNLIYNAFLVQIFLKLIFFIFPVIFDKYYLFFNYLFTNFVLKNLFITMITLYIIPITVALILEFSKIKNKIFLIFKQNLLDNKMYLLLLTSFVFASNHVDFSFKSLLNFNILSLIQFATTFVFGYFMFKFTEYISLRFSIFYHSFYNSIIALGATIFWQRPIAIYYTIGLSAIVIITLAGMFLEYKKIVKLN